MSREVAVRHRWLLVDAAVLLWVVGWMLVGTAVSREVDGLRQFADTLDEAAGAIEQTARAFRPLEGLPFVGDDVRVLSDRARAAAVSARVNAAASRESAERLRTLLGMTVAAAPTAPLVAIYLPFRIARIRETRAVRLALRRRGEDPALQRTLANRALHRLSYRHLLVLSPDPSGDVDGGRYQALAAAELRRLGIRRRPRDRASTIPAAPT